MRERTLPRTRALSWPAFTIISGLLLAFVAWATRQLRPPPPWPDLLPILVLIGLGAVLTGAALILLRRWRSHRGLDLARGTGRSASFAGIAALLLGAFAVSLWPIPYPYTWLGTAVPLIAMGLALVLGVRMVGNGTPMAYRRAQQARGRGEDDAALKLLSEAEEERPGFVGIPYLRAVIYRNRGDQAAARGAAKRLISLRPDLYYGHAELGLSLLADGRPQEALGPLRTACATAPHLAVAQYNLGMACVEVADKEGALSAFARALSLGMGDEVAEIGARYHVYRALEALGESRRAQVELRHLRRLAGARKRWRQELAEGDMSATDRRRGRALLAAIERELGARTGR